MWDSSPISPRRLCSHSRDKTAHGGAVLSEAGLKVAGSGAFLLLILMQFFVNIYS